MADSERNADAIAIIGMALRVPGARDLATFSRNLEQGRESIRFYSDEELREAGVSAAELAKPNYVKAGAPLDELEMFDSEFFGFSPKEAAILDPQHRQFMECAVEALEHAAAVPSRFRGAVGVFAGCGMGTYFAQNLLTNRKLLEDVGFFLLRHTGNDKDFLATRLSYCLDLRGPSVSVQTACSTSLVAVHMACQSLLSAECDMALAGGSTIEFPHRRGYVYQEGEILSPDGHCRALDHRAQGTIFGSGVGVVVLKRLEDALADGDPIDAVILGSAVNNDGTRKVGYLAPSVDGQTSAIVEALSVAGVSADSIGYVETHGTGTPMGDPIELAALTQAFSGTNTRRGYCGVGSVKSNIGHLDTAAGVVALIKTALCLKRGTLFPTINFERPNPHIEFERGPFYPVAELSDWPAELRPRRASVNSLGVGGTNAHMVLEEPPPVRTRSQHSSAPQLLLLSGKSTRALNGNQQRLAEALRADPELPLSDVAYTLYAGREWFRERRVLAARDRDEAIALLEGSEPSRLHSHTALDRPTPAFMFPGGGAQYPGMGAGLYASDPVFREHVEHGLDLARELVGRDLRPFLVCAEDAAPGLADELQRPSLQLPLLFIVEYALCQSWRALGVEPRALIGHSMGENTAAAVAEVMSYRDALGLVALRGRLFETVAGGGMSSVPLSAAALEPMLPEGVVIACHNAPELCVASGPAAALEQLERELVARDIEPSRIRIQIAAHSPMLDPILNAFGAYLRGIRLSPPKLPIISNLTGEFLTDELACDPSYWVRHLREPVRFADGLATLTRTGARALLEVGPGRTLGSLARHGLGKPAGTATVASLRHPDEQIDDGLFRLAALGQLAAIGVELDLARHFDPQARRVVLPSYAFDHKPYFIEPGRITAEGELRRLASIEEWFFKPAWRFRELEPDDMADTGPLTWLLFADELGVADELGRRLRARGHRVVFVRKGAAYGQPDQMEYQLAPGAPHGYGTLVQELIASDKTPQRIVHLWSVTPRIEPGPYRYDAGRRLDAFDSPLYLVQALSAENVTGPLHLLIGTTYAQQLSDEPLPHPEKAMAQGITRVVPRELPEYSCSHVDLPPPRLTRRLFGGPRAQNLGELVDALAAECRSIPRNTSVIYRGGHRFEQGVEAQRRQPDRSSPLREHGVYLITGGLGGLGLSIARHLAKRYRARLLLVSRTGLPDRASWDDALAQHTAPEDEKQRIRSVRELEAAGAEVEVLAADVASFEQMRAGLERARTRFGVRIHGVFHAAGLLDDELLQLKTRDDIEEVLRPKVGGTWVLHQLLSRSGLELMVLFSSTSTVIGPPGQADYVAANSFLNAYAEAQQRRLGPRVLAINWGIWRDVGMAAKAAQAMSREAAGDPATPIESAFFTTRRDLAGGGAIFSGAHAARATWWLDDHRLADGTAVMPGTGYLQLGTAAARLLQPGEVAFELRDFAFLRPMPVADQQPLAMRVRLRPDEHGDSIEVQSLQTDAAGHELGYLTHALGRVRALGAAPRPAPLDLDSIAARCGRVLEDTESGTLRTAQEGHLRFGPRFRVLHRARYGDGEALGELGLPETLSAELNETPLHAGMLDVGTGFAMELIEGYSAATGLWAPLSYGCVRVFAPLPARTVTWVRLRGPARASEGLARFDVTLCDPDGRVCVEVEELCLRRLAAGASLSDVPAPSPGELEPASAAPSPSARQLSPAEALFRNNLEAGITPLEAGEALERALASRSARLIVSSLEITELCRQMDDITRVQPGDAAAFTRPDLSTEYVAPRNELETRLLGIFEKHLGVSQIGVRDSFFELGGHSLIAVRLASEVRAAFGIDLSLSTLFEVPTVERLAERVAIECGGALDEATDAAPAPARKPVWSPIVRIKPDGSLPPIFCVAGQGGNPMHLRTLAHHLGPDQPFYGLEHRGADGRGEPYASVEEMARDFIAHVNQLVAPDQPLFIAGYSGGGTAAFEMGRQLLAAGREIGPVLLLDSFCPVQPDLGLAWNLQIHLEGFRADGAAYLRRRLQNRLESERRWIERRFFRRAHPVAQTQSLYEAAAAKWRAIESRYEPEPYPGPASLFRVTFVDTNEAAYFAQRYGGWRHLFLGGVDEHLVPGTHVSMCEEPHVQVLAQRIREVVAASRPPERHASEPWQPAFDASAES